MKNVFIVRSTYFGADIIFSGKTLSGESDTFLNSWIKLGTIKNFAWYKISPNRIVQKKLCMNFAEHCITDFFSGVNNQYKEYTYELIDMLKMH